MEKVKKILRFIESSVKISNIITLSIALHVNTSNLSQLETLDLLKKIHQKYKVSIRTFSNFDCIGILNEKGYSDIDLFVDKKVLAFYLKRKSIVRNS